MPDLPGDLFTGFHDADLPAVDQDRMIVISGDFTEVDDNFPPRDEVDHVPGVVHIAGRAHELDELDAARIIGYSEHSFAPPFEQNPMF